MFINVVILKMAFERWKRRISMRGIIIFSHDFIHATIIIIMIFVIRWTLGWCWFILILNTSATKSERNLCWLRFRLWHSRHRRQNGSRSVIFIEIHRWIPFRNLFFKTKDGTTTTNEGSEREENLLSDGTTYNYYIRCTNTHYEVGFARLENFLRFSVYPTSASGTSRPFKQPIATLRHTLESSAGVLFVGGSGAPVLVPIDYFPTISHDDHFVPTYTA